MGRRLDSVNPIQSSRIMNERAALITNVTELDLTGSGSGASQTGFSPGHGEPYGGGYGAGTGNQTGIGYSNAIGEGAGYGDGKGTDYGTN